MSVVTIEGDEFTVYGFNTDGVADADEYAKGASHATAWRALTTDDEKGRYMVTATRLLDRQRWKGEKTVEGQDLAWPRTGTGVEGVEDDVIPVDIVHACFELSFVLADGSDVQYEQNTAQKIASLGAGSVNISYFRGAEGLALRFPLPVHELVRDYLAGSSLGSGLVLSHGVEGESVTNQDFGYSGGI
jgi:hypothetical protein